MRGVTEARRAAWAGTPAVEFVRRAARRGDCVIGILNAWPMWTVYRLAMVVRGGIRQAVRSGRLRGKGSSIPCLRMNSSVSAIAWANSSVSNRK